MFRQLDKGRLLAILHAFELGNTLLFRAQDISVLF